MILHPSAMEAQHADVLFGCGTHRSTKEQDPIGSVLAHPALGSVISIPRGNSAAVEATSIEIAAQTLLAVCS